MTTFSPEASLNSSPALMPTILNNQPDSDDEYSELQKSYHSHRSNQSQKGRVAMGENIDGVPDSPPDGDDEPAGQSRKSAYYDYAQDRTFKQTDAKLFYSQSRGGPGGLENASVTSQSPAMHPRNVAGGQFLPLDHHQQVGGSRGVSRSASIKSMSRHGHLPHQKTAMPLGYASYDKPLGEPEIQAPPDGGI